MTNSPEDYARALLHHLKIDRVADAEKAARECGLKIRDVDSSNFEGALVRTPDGSKGIIAVKRNIREAGRRKFTVAHEIGHFVIPNHGLAECYCKSAMIESWKKDVIRVQEYEANRFASELLLPARVLYSMINPASLTLSKVKHIAEQFSTSLTATAVKCVEVAEERCAVVFMVGGVIKWAMRNDGFRLFIPNGPVTPKTMAGRLFDNPQVRELSGEVHLGEWTNEESVSAGATCWEESIALPFYNAVISIISL